MLHVVVPRGLSAVSCVFNRKLRGVLRVVWRVKSGVKNTNQHESEAAVTARCAAAHGTELVAVQCMLKLIAGASRQAPLHRRYPRGTAFTVQLDPHFFELVE